MCSCRRGYLEYGLRTEVQFLGPPRFRVRFRQEGSPRLISSGTLAGKLPIRRRSAGALGDVVVWTDQRDGSIQVVSTGLVQDIVEEKQDRYEDWHLIRTLTPNDL